MWAGKGIQLNPDINISVAMAVTDGVVGAVIPKADSTSLADISVQRRDLAERARGGKLKPSDVANGTFSITNLGMYGVTSFTAVINPPQAAILAVGKMEQKPVVRDGEVVARHGMNITIACDHRILSGAPAAEFLARVKAILERPLALAL